MITLNFDEVLKRVYNAQKGVEVRYGLGQGFEYCKQFADEAQGYATNAKASEKKATDAVAGIEQTKTDAVQAVQNAQSTATTAVQQAQSTATTAVTTKQTEAVQAVGTAQTGAVKAVNDERDAALQQVADSTATAKGYAESAASAANAAGSAATAAGGYASNAESSATAASGSASAAATSESNAATSAQSSKTDADRAEAAAELAGTRANTDKTLKIENAPADAKAVGDYILDSEGNVIFYSKAAVDKLLAGKLDLTGGTMSGPVNFSGGQNGSILSGDEDAANVPGGALNNLVIRSWWGVSFTTNCPNQTYTGKTAIGIDCRDGIIKAPRFEGPADNGVVASGSNYVRFGDGTQICWGLARDGAIPHNATFPVPFISEPSIVAVRHWSGATGAADTEVWVYDTTLLTGFKIGSNQGIYANWTAIGRWK